MQFYDLFVFDKKACLNVKGVGSPILITIDYINKSQNVICNT